jgi:hypothetical protein
MVLTALDPSSYFPRRSMKHYDSTLTRQYIVTFTEYNTHQRSSRRARAWDAIERMRRPLLIYGRSYPVRVQSGEQMLMAGFGIYQSSRIAGDRIHLLVSQSSIREPVQLTNTVTDLIREVFTHMPEAIDFTLIPRPEGQEQRTKRSEPSASEASPP